MDLIYILHDCMYLKLYSLSLSFQMQTLSLQRQMMENLIIAKARQDAVSFCRQLLSCALCFLETSPISIKLLVKASLGLITNIIWVSTTAVSGLHSHSILKFLRWEWLEHQFLWKLNI